MHNRKLIVITCLSVILLWVAPADALDIYFVRHAETMGNLTGDYSEYNQKHFSDLGKKQIKELTEQISDKDFDYVITSPKLRTINTILPYLMKKNKIAEIWPEIAECCWQANRAQSPTHPFTVGSLIRLDGTKKDFFSFRDDKTMKFYRNGNYADGMERLKKAHSLLLERFSGKDVSVLIVGHSLAGGRLIEMLLNQEPNGTHFPGNARLWQLRETAPGNFKLIFFNRPPLEK